MRSIHKVVLNVADEQTIVLPKNSVPLSVAEQRGALCLWYGFTKSDEQEQRTVYIIGTGNPVPDVDLGTFMGTVVMLEGALVWHVFVADRV